MMPPCRPGRRVSRSHRRALCQSFAACLRDIAANRTGPATLLRHTGQGARVWEKPDRTTEIESKGASGVAAQPARKRLILGALCRYTPKGLAKFGEVGKSRYCHIRDLPGPGRYADPPSEAGFAFQRFWCRGLAQMEPCARRIPRAPRACIRMPRRATG